MAQLADVPLISVVILNYNGKVWIPRCLESLAAQTVFSKCEIIIADNASTDGSDLLAQALLAGWPNGLFLQNGANAGFGAGSNLAAKLATGKYLLFLNPDVWLETDCLEQLFGAAERAHAGVAGVLVLDYEDNTFQSNGSWRFDLFGHGVSIPSGHAPEELFCSHGFSFIRRDLFWRVGGYDDEFFLYGEEGDLSWRAWIAGDKIVYVPTARIHHRGAAEVNPKGGERIVELRTSDSKRFYANRNHLLILMKNCQHVLLLLLVPALCLLVLESLGGMLLSRRWSFFKRSCLEAVGDCWRLRRHICEQRRSIRTFRKRGDLWMLRFFSWRFGRWQEYKRIFTLGIPIVDKR